MKSEITWKDAAPKDRDGNHVPVYSVVYSSDGSQLIAGMGRNVVMYDAVTGAVFKNLRGHKDTVYSLAYSKKGKIFASGGADCNVIIWSAMGEGKLKFSHEDSIQALAFNPVTGQLASCTKKDFGLWSPDEMDVKKISVASKILCCSWTNDGQHIAFGMYDGTISIRNNKGVEKVVINRKAPVWTLAWNPSRDEDNVLAVGCWDQTLSFYHVSGEQLGKDRNIDSDPLSLSYFSNGEYICIGDNDRRVSLWTKDGVRLTNISEEEDWCWSVCPRPNQNYVAIGTNGGKIFSRKLNFETVHGLYRDLYAYRNYMTDVVVHNLATDQKIRIRCRDHIRKMAIFKNRLLVQLPQGTVVYDIIEDDDNDLMSHEIISTIVQELECVLMLATANHIVLCHEKAIHLHDVKGAKLREWNMDALIRYAKVVGGPSGKEALLVALENGRVLMIYVDNPFPVELVKLGRPVRCVDINSSRRKLAIVDDQKMCSVYDIKRKQFLFQESGAKSVAWNAEHEDMLAFSDGGMVCIKTDTFPVHRQRLVGEVIGFRGSKVYCLNVVSINTVDIPQSSSMYQFIERGDFDGAHRVACLGVTESDWRALAMQALLSMRFDIARKGFIRVRDVKYLMLLDKLQRLQQVNQTFNEFEYRAEIMAYQGKYEEAARLYVQADKPDVAMDMLCDLRMFDEAKRLAADLETVDIKHLILRQAKTAEDDNDWRSASEMYVVAKEYDKAIAIMEKHSWFDALMDMCHGLNETEEASVLSKCAEVFTRRGKNKYAREVLLKLKDYGALIRLHVSTRQWHEAFALLKSHPQYNLDVYLPFAEYLAQNDQFDLAQRAFKKAKRPLEALKMIETLTNNAIAERRYSDSAYYLLELAMENLKLTRDGSWTDNQDTVSAEERVRLYHKLRSLSRVYFAYDKIHRYTELPFRETDLHHLFNIAIYVLNNIGSLDTVPRGVSRVSLLIVLGRLATALGAYGLAREAFQRLIGLHIPPHLRDEVDLASISINGKPMTNDENLVPICYRCSATNPLLSADVGDACASCNHPYVRSFITFDILPLVEFELLPDITDSEALALIEQEPSSSRRRKNTQGTEPVRTENSERLQIADTLDVAGESDSFNESDKFNRMILSTDFSSQSRRGDYVPLRIGRDMLRSLRKEEVFVVRSRTPHLRSRFYKNMFPQKTVMQCLHCDTFFDEGYEFESLKRGGTCPVCRKPSAVSNGHGTTESKD